MRFKLAMCALAALGVVVSASGMTRWEALSMLETGNSDGVVGRCGEISRYQIRAELWPGGNPQNAQAALTVARSIMQDRIQHFQKTHGRSPSDFEFYVLWNAPAQVDHPVSCVVERAQRFVNLVQRNEHPVQASVPFRKAARPS
jgi:hypothetical protein